MEQCSACSIVTIKFMADCPSGHNPLGMYCEFHWMQEASLYTPAFVPVPMSNTVRE